MIIGFDTKKIIRELINSLLCRYQVELINQEWVQFCAGLCLLILLQVP